MNTVSPLRWLLPLIVAVLTFVSCRVSENDDGLIVTAPPEYTVDLFEQRDPLDGAPTFGLWIESLEKYECPGYNIVSQITLQGSKIAVTVSGVTAPVPCAGDSAHAKQFLPIGNLPDGLYEFTFSLRDVIVNSGTLEVAAGHYSLSLPDAKGIVVENYVLESMPDGIIWGYAATPDEASQPIADDFLADLKTLTTENDLTPGFYSYFTVSGTGNIALHKSIAPGGPARQFVRRLNASSDDLKGLLQDYRSATPQPLDIKCWTTEGER